MVMMKQKTALRQLKPGDIVRINEKYEFNNWYGKIGNIIEYHEYIPDVAKKHEHAGFYTLNVKKTNNHLCVYRHEIDFVKHQESK